MSVNEGSIRAQLELDLSNLQGQVDAALGQFTRLGKAIQDVPSLKPKVDTDEGKKKAEDFQGVLKDTVDAIAKLSGGRVNIEVGEAESKIEGVTKALGTLSSGLATSGVAVAVTGAAIVGAFAEIEHVLVEMGEHWEAAFRQMSAQTGITGEALERFEQSAVNVGTHSAASTESIVTAMQQLSVRTGVTGGDLEALTSQVLKYSKVTGQDAGPAATSLAQIFTQFHEPASAFGNDINIILRAAQQTGIPFAELQEALKGRLAPTLQALGFDLAGSALLLGKMAQNGEVGRAALVGLNKVLDESAKAGKDPQVVFAQLVEDLKNAGDISTATGSKLAEQLGVRGFAFLSTLARNGALDVKGAGAAIRESGDTADAAFDRIRSGADKIGASLTILRNQFAPLGIEIAKAINSLQEGLAGRIDLVTAAVRNFNQAREDALAHGTGPSLPTGTTQTALQVIARVPPLIPLLPLVAAAKAFERPARQPTTEAASPGEPVSFEGEALPGAAGGAAQSVRSLADQITRLDKQIAEAGTNTALIEQLQRTRQALEETQKATSGLDAATTARLVSEQHAAALADDTATATRKAADAAINQAGVLREQANSAVTASEAAEKLNAIYLAEPGLLGASAKAADSLTLANDAAADAQNKRKAASAALQAAHEGEATAARLEAEAEAAAADAAEKSAKAHTDAVQAHAQFAVVTERTNGLLAAAKPFLDAQAEAAIKAAESEGHYSEALQIAGHALGLTDEQIQHLEASLGGSRQAYDQQVNSVKALNTSHDEQLRRLDSLAGAAYPNLTAAQADALKQTVAGKDAQASQAAIAAALGISQAQLAQILGESSEQAAKHTKELQAGNRALGEYVSDENKSRISGVFGELAKATDSVTAAQAKQLEQSGKTNEALTLLLQHAGASPGAIAALAASLEAGGAAAFDAQEKIKALVTYVRDQSGQVRLKVDVDIEKTQQAIGDLQTSFRDSNVQRADAEAKATETYVQQGISLNRQQDKNAETHLSNIADINKARSDSTRQLEDDIGKATSAANEASTKLDEKIDDAIDKHALAIADAQDKYGDTVAKAQETLGKGLESMAERTRGIVQQAADAAASALHTVSGAMQSYNDQQRITANATSIQQENARLQGYGFTDFQSQQSALRATQIQAEGTAGLAQVAGANQLNQTLVGANQSLQKATEKATEALNKVSQETTKLYDTYRDTVGKAGDAFEKAVRNADLAEDKSIRDANEQLALIQRHLADSVTQAKAADEKRQRDLKEREDKENQRYFEEQQRIAEQRKKQDEEFDLAEKARRDAQRKADDAYLKQLRQLDAQLDSLKALKSLPGDTADAIAARVKIGEQQFLAGATINNLETQVDFLSTSIGEFARQSRGR